MDEKDWTILDILAQERNITRTAERMFLSQPSLTYRLQQLERELGVPLLVYRGRRGIEFTGQGDRLVEYAREMLKRWGEMKEELAQGQGEVRGTLRLGISRSVALYRLPDVLRRFSQQYPLVEFDISTALSQDLVDSVSSQKEQIGIVRGNPQWPDAMEMLEQEQVCILSAVPIDPEELPNRRRIAFTTDPMLSRIIENWWKQHYSQLSNVLMHVDNAEIAKRMVQNDLGYAIVPSIVLDGDDRELYRLPLAGEDGEAILWTTWMLYRQELLELPAVKAFVHFIQAHYRQSIPSLYANP